MTGFVSSVTVGLGEDSYSKPVPLRLGMTPTQVFAKVDVTRSTNVAAPDEIHSWAKSRAIRACEKKGRD